MKGNVEKKAKLKFKGRKHSKQGVFSMLLSFAVLGGFAAASIMSGLEKGNGSILLGYIGIGCLLAAVLGFILGVRSFKEPDILYFQPIFGSFINGVMIIVLVALYLTGILM